MTFKTYPISIRCFWAIVGVLLASPEAVISSSKSPDGMLRSAPEEWRMFRGNTHLTGVQQGSLPDDPQVIWTFQASDAIESTAAIAGGNVYFGTLDGAFYAVDFATGKEQWRRQTPAEIKSSPTIYDEKVYFGNGYGNFYALSATTGDSLWGFETGAEIISSPNIFDNKVLFGSYDDFLYCLSATTGELMWKLETQGYVHGSPAIRDGYVFSTGCDGFLRSVEIATGKESGKVELGDYVASSPSLSGKFAFFGTFGNQVQCVDVEAQNIVWRYEHPSRKLPFYSSAATTTEFVVIGGRDKLVHALEPATGVVKWTYSVRSKIESSPVIVGEKVVLATSGGNILILRLDDGQLLWEFESGSSTVASPAVAANRIVIGTDDGVLYCFGEKNE
jgi:outer membrane protein assembly factor BamB